MKMKVTVLSSFLLSTFLVGSVYAATETPMERDLTQQEMRDVIGQGTPYFHINHTGTTWVYHWNQGHNHSHQATVAAGNYYGSFHAVNAGVQTQLQCQNSAGSWMWFGIMPAGNQILHCHNGPG